jgi:hypothetical protein
MESVNAMLDLNREGQEYGLSLGVFFGGGLVVGAYT